MTCESFDNFLTLALTAMIYGTGLWLAISFPLFVVRRDLSANPEEKLEPTSTQAIAQADVGTKTEAQQLQPTVIAESPTPSFQPETLKHSASQIVSAPVDFGLWKVADLRWTKLRETFDIPLRPRGETRAFKKTELKALYLAAMARPRTKSQSTLHLVGG